MDPANEEPLRRDVAAGNDAAFERLYHECAPRVRLVAWRFCRRGDVAEDLANEAWCRAYQARTSYDPARPFLAWVCGILHNVWREHARSSALSEGAAAKLLLSDEDAIAVSPEAAMAEAELLEALEQCVARLESGDRDLVRWRFFDNQSLRAVAQKVGIPEATLREHRLPGIIARLQACLRSKGIKPELFLLFSCASDPASSIP